MSVSDRNRDIYNNTDVPMNLTHAKKIMSLMPDLSGKKILDIGCHDGRWSRFFSECKYYGVEISDAAKKARKKGLRVRQYDIERGLPYKDNYFDILFARDVIEHIYDTDFFLMECRRVLKPGGMLVFTTPNVGSVNTRIRLFFLGQTPSYISSLEDIGHAHIFSVSDIKQHLQRNRFRSFRIVGSYLYILPFLRENEKSVFYKFISKVATRFPTISAGLIVLATK